MSEASREQPGEGAADPGGYRGALESELFRQEAVDELYGSDRPRRRSVELHTGWSRWGSRALAVLAAAALLVCATIEVPTYRQASAAVLGFEPAPPQGGRAARIELALAGDEAAGLAVGQTLVAGAREGAEQPLRLRVVARRAREPGGAQVVVTAEVLAAGVDAVRLRRRLAGDRLLAVSVPAGDEPLIGWFLPWFRS